jgi:hypothetical protein
MVYPGYNMGYGLLDIMADAAYFEQWCCFAKAGTINHNYAKAGTVNHNYANNRDEKTKLCESRDDKP